MKTPECIEIERHILSSFFQSKELLLKYIPIVLSEYFYISTHQKLYSFFKSSLIADLSLALDKFPNDTQEIMEIFSHSSSSSSLDEMILILKDRYYRRQLISASHKTIQFCESDYDRTAIEISENGISDLILKDTNCERPETIAEILPRMFDNLQATISGEGLKTGLIDLDNKMGILLPAEYIMLAGRPSMGKTALALCIARNMTKKQYPVLIFSLETTKEIICSRVVFGESNCSYDKILRGNTVELTKAKENIDNVINIPIFIDDTCSPTMGHIGAIAENYVKNFGVKVIMIDHIGLIKGKGGERNDELSTISKEIKALLKKLNVTGIILCQLSRAVEKRSPPIPIMSDLRDSGTLEEDTDKVIFVYREEYYNRKSDKKGIADVIVAKNKNGQTGYDEILFDSTTMNFRSLTNENRPEARTEF